MTRRKIRIVLLCTGLILLYGGLSYFARNLQSAYIPKDSAPSKHIKIECWPGTQFYRNPKENGVNEGCVKDFGDAVLMHGPQIQYWPNGQPRSVETYVAGKREGEAKGYHEDGKISRIENAKDGMLDGRCTYFDSAGNKTYEAIFSEGRPTKEITRP